MNKWLAHLQQLARASEPCVLVTVCDSRGSTPRETGAKMVVTRGAVIGSIGGGRLEHSCIKSACEWLQQGSDTGRSKTRRLVLGTNCGQCCGGVVEILFEEITPAQRWWIDALAALVDAGVPAAMVTICGPRTQVCKWVITADDWLVRDADSAMTAAERMSAPPQQVLDAARGCLDALGSARQITVTHGADAKIKLLLEPVHTGDFKVAVFGAGHVGSACVNILTQLEATIYWVDSRPDLMSDIKRTNLRTVVTDPPARIVKDLPAELYYLIMTHDHALDFELCAEILQRTDVRYCGLIGSGAKRRRFIQRLTAAGLLPEQIAQLTCPIGINLIAGKKPAEIAVAVAAELLSLRESHARRDLLTPVSAKAMHGTTRMKFVR